MRRGSSGPLKRLRRIGLAASLAAAALVATASSATASVTIGQLAPSPPGVHCSTDSFDLLQPTVTSGTPYVVPANGTITSWSTNAYSANAGQKWAMKVFHPLGGLDYMVVGHDSRALTPSARNTFAASVPVRTGDVLGLQQNDGSAVNSACLFEVARESGYRFKLGNLADGESGTFGPVSDRRLNITAVVEPTNAFKLGQVKSKKKKGTGTLTVEHVFLGELALAGKGVKRVAKTVTAPGDAKLKIRAKGKKKRKLEEDGKVKLKAKVTFTPTGGDPSTQSRKLKLKKR